MVVTCVTEYRGSWTADEVAAFLEEQSIPARVAARRPDGSLWIVALWYRYRDGAFECATRASADLVAFLRDDARVGVEVSTNEVPYRGVRGCGTAAVAPDEDRSVLGSLVDRYLGDRDSPLAESLLDRDRAEVRIRIDPDAIYSWDYTERMRGVERVGAQ